MTPSLCWIDASACLSVCHSKALTSWRLSGRSTELAISRKYKKGALGPAFSLSAGSAHSFAPENKGIGEFSHGFLWPGCTALFKILRQVADHLAQTAQPLACQKRNRGLRVLLTPPGVEQLADGPGSHANVVERPAKFAQRGFVQELVRFQLPVQ